MSDRFKTFKPSNKNTFVGGNTPPIKTTSRFDSLADSNSDKNRFKSSKPNNTNNTGNFTKSNKFGRGRGRGRRSLRDYSNNKVESRIGKFSQVGTGEVNFTPKFKCGKTTQKQRKKKREKEELKVINKKDEEEDDWNSLQNQEDIALTLAMAQQYQYYTESEEGEEEEGVEED